MIHNKMKRRFDALSVVSMLLDKKVLKKDIFKPQEKRIKEKWNAVKSCDK